MIEISVELIGLAAANIGAVIGTYVKLSTRVTKIEAQQSFLIKAFENQYGLNTGEQFRYRGKK